MYQHKDRDLVAQKVLVSLQLFITLIFVIHLSPPSDIQLSFTFTFISRAVPPAEISLPEEQCLAIEALLRERRPTVTNSDELMLMMQQTRCSRRLWISETHPTISEIFKRYPRLTDLPGAVSSSFSKC